MRHTDENGKVFFSVTEIIETNKMDNCHKCPFNMVDGVMQKDCKTIGDFCLEVEQGFGVYFVELKA